MQALANSFSVATAVTIFISSLVFDVVEGCQD